MAINTSQIDLMGGLDEVVMNQRVRAYVPGAQGVAGGDPTGGGLQYGTLWMQGTGVATSLTAGNKTITAAQLGSGIIVQTPTAATAWTLDTAANILAYMQANSAGVSIGDILICDVINASSTAGATITITPGSGGALDTNQSTLSMLINTSRTLFFRITAISTPAYVVYG